MKVSGHMISYNKIYNETHTGKLPSFANAGWPAGFVNNDGTECAAKIL